MSLEEAVYNTLLFLPGKGEEKSQASLGWARLHVNKVFKPFNCLLEGADNFVWSVTEFDAELPEGTFWIHREKLKEIQKREGLTFRPEDIQVDCPAESVQELYDGYAQLWRADTETVGSVFAVNPNRVAKFSLLKPQDDFPADFQVCSMSLLDQEKKYLKWKMGPATYGILGVLDRQVIEQVIPKDALW